MSEAMFLALIPLIRTCVICGTVLISLHKVLKVVKTAKFKTKNMLFEAKVQKGGR